MEERIATCAARLMDRYSRGLSGNWYKQTYQMIDTAKGKATAIHEVEFLNRTWTATCITCGNTSCKHAREIQAMWDKAKG